MKSHFWVPWHSPKMLCLTLTILQLSQLLVAFCCRDKGPFTFQLLWCPLTMTAEISQEQTECLGTTSIFLWMLKWYKGREGECLRASWVNSCVQWPELGSFQPLQQWPSSGKRGKKQCGPNMLSFYSGWPDRGGVISVLYFPPVLHVQNS